MSNTVEGVVKVESHTSSGGHVVFSPDNVDWRNVIIEVKSHDGRTDARVRAEDLLRAVRWIVDAQNARGDW